MQRFHTSVSFGPESLAVYQRQFLRKWQETVDDAQAVLFEAQTPTSLVSFWNLQVAFAVRNMQRWAEIWEPAVAEPVTITPVADPVVPVSSASTVNMAGSIDRPVEPALSEKPVDAAVEPTLDTAGTSAIEIQRAVAAALGTDKAVFACDDLKRIRGIGPAIEEKLHARGIFRFEQLAALDARSIAQLDAVLDFKGRIERDNWVRQASLLAASADAT